MVKKESSSLNSKNDKKKITLIQKKSERKLRKKRRIFGYHTLKIKQYFRSFKKYILPPEPLKNEERPRSYAFKKEFIGIYLFFVFYSFLLILAINNPSNLTINALTLGRPFDFGATIIAYFIVLAILLSLNKVRYWTFDNKRLFVSYSKLIILSIGIFTPLFILMINIITPNFNITSLMLILSITWLIILSYKFYTYSRRFSTNIEEKFISKYSKSRSFIASIGPIVILGLLITMALFYRTFLVIFTINILGAGDPAGTIEVYKIEMQLVMPLIYVSLILTFLFIVLEFVFTRRLAETKRSGKFDNFTFSLIVFFIFFFQIMQVSLFLFMRPETVSTLQNVSGASVGAIYYVFAIEFLISMFFLYRVLVKTGKTFGWRILFFKKDGVVLMILTCIFAQTLTQYANTQTISGQDLTLVGNFLQYSKFFISILFIIFLGLTLIIYYLKPQQTSMFIRILKETIREEEKDVEKLYILIKNEYIRRGSSFSLKIIENDLVKSLKLPISDIYNLANHLGEKHIDISLELKTDKKGNIIDRIIEFFSITDIYEKKDLAKKKAKKFLSERLVDTMSLDKKKRNIELSKNLDNDKASDQFISALSTKYSKIHRSKGVVTRKKNQGHKILTAKREFSRELKEKILQILKKEYLYRIESEKKYPDFHYPISEIVFEIQRHTKISAGELYLILERIADMDIELTLIDNPEEPEDKRIMFYLIADESLMAAIKSFRPEEYIVIRANILKNFIETLSTPKTLTRLKNVKEGISAYSEKERIWSQLISYFIKEYLTYKNYYISMFSKKELKKVIDLFPVNDSIDIFTFD